MSLRIFHIFFILVSIIFLLGFGVREAHFFQLAKSTPDILFSAASFVLAVLMSVYLRWFVSKKKAA